MGRHENVDLEELALLMGGSFAALVEEEPENEIGDG